MEYVFPKKYYKNPFCTSTIVFKDEKWIIIGLDTQLLKRLILSRFKEEKVSKRKATGK